VVRVVAALVLVVDGWLLLAVVARRLPPGQARDLARFLPDCLTMLRRLWADPRVPRRAQVALGLAALWVLSPVDLIPEFLPVIGPVDDVVVVALSVRYALRRVPEAALEEAWPGDPEVLRRLVGPPSTVAADGQRGHP
jgi:uncharacterized membrane protein YkvA (DUF1232 family)